MPYDWKALAPTRPLEVSDIGPGGLYVSRTGAGAREISALLSVGLEQPVALFGPAGVGKSTELAALAKEREANWVGPLIRLDKLLEYSDATSVDDVLDAIAKFTIQLAIEKLRLKLSPELEAAIGHKPATTKFPPRKPFPVGPIPKGFDLLLAAVREIRGVSQQGAVGLLVDGLEKASLGLATKTLVNLERLRSETSIVVVVPTAVATGPAGAVLHDYHVVSLGPIIADTAIDPSGSQGFDFLFEVAARRLGVAPGEIGQDSSWDTTAVAIRGCIKWSGGLIRTFLQLLQKAALYAAMDQVRLTRKM